MERCGLIGRPLGHSSSSVIFNTTSRLTQKPEGYFLYEVHEPLIDAVKRMYDGGVQGFNVTLPFKKEIIPLLKQLDPEASEIGAVNCCLRTENGYRGFNTDAPGLMMSMDEAGIDISGRHILLIGAGGGARAAAWVCRKKKAASITVLNRTRANAEKLREDILGLCTQKKALTPEASGDTRHKDMLKVDVITYEDQAEYLKRPGAEERYTAIQCTSVGMYPETDRMPQVEEEFFRRLDAAVDIIYNPEETAFLKKAASYHIPCLSGLDMLICQAMISRQIWLKETVSGEVCAQVKEAVTEWLHDLP